MLTDRFSVILSLVYISFELVAIVSSQDTIRCRLCNQASTLSECNKLAICDKTLEECYMDELITDQLTVVYQGGCRSKDVCARAGKKRNSLVTCSSCCSIGDDCNKRLCGIKDDTLNSSQCFSCDHRTSTQSEVKDPSTCVTLSTCQQNEVCYTNEADVMGTHTYFYGCMSKFQCRFLMSSSYNEYKKCVSSKTGLPPGPERDHICGTLARRSTSLCHSCCADGGCNYGTCQEQNARIFKLAENGKFDMTTLKAL